MKPVFKRTLTLLLALCLSVSAIGYPLAVPAAESGETQEAGTEPAAVPTETAAAKTQETETEAILYYAATLLRKEGLSFDYETDREDPDADHPADKDADTVLLYAPGEEISVTFSTKDGYSIAGVHIYGRDLMDIRFSWEEEDTVVFRMPDEDVWVDVSLVTPLRSGQDGAEEGETDGTYQTAAQAETSGSNGEGEAYVPGQENTQSETLQAYEPETEEDGLPKAGSIVSVEPVTIPSDAWDFNPCTDFTNLGYEGDSLTVTYISDDIDYSAAGTYSTIYRVDDSESGKYWFVLRPVVVAAKGEETAAETEAKTETDTETEAETETDTETEAETETDTETETEAETEAWTEDATEEGTGAGAGSKTGIEDPDTAVMALSAEETVEDTAEESAADTRMLFTSLPGTFDISKDGFLYVNKEFQADTVNMYAGTVWRTLTIDGVTYNVYCLEPSKSDPEYSYSRSAASSISLSSALGKALYYLYGGPGWGATVNGVNLSDLFSEAGAGSYRYALTHYILAYIYLGAGGDWNAWVSHSPVINSDGQAFIRKAANLIESFPVPSASLSATSLAGTYDSASGMSVTGSVTFSSFGAYSDGNFIKTTVPSGVTLVVTGSNARTYASGKTARVYAGESFYMKADTGVTGDMTLEFAQKYSTDASAYTISNSDAQDLGFVIFPEDETYSISVDWPDTRVIRVQKYDRDTGLAQPNNTAASFAGAVYTIYSDSSCTAAVEAITTDSTGAAQSSRLPMQNYWVKETKAPTGYNPDTTVYPVTGSDVEVTVNSTEEVIKGSVSLMKYLDDDMTEAQLQDLYDSRKLEGITFTLSHEDPDVNDRMDRQDPDARVIVTDRYGYAGTGYPLVYGTWTITESNTPDGYDGLESARIRITQQGVELKYVVSNTKIHIAVQIVKKDLATGNTIPVAGAKFQVLDNTGTPLIMQDNMEYGRLTDTFTTGADGTLTLTSALDPGTYTLVETFAPEGYVLAAPFTFEAAETATVEEPLIVECYDTVQTGRIQITKLNKDGAVLGEGFTFEIYVGDADITDPAGTVRTITVDGGEIELTAGRLVETVSTSDNGIAVSGSLPVGGYVVREVQAAQYYAISAQDYPVTIGFDREEESVVATVQAVDAKTSFNLYKVNAEDETAALEGIRFRIFSSADVEAEKALQIARAVEALRADQQAEMDGLFTAQAEELAAIEAEYQGYYDAYVAGGHTEEEITAFEEENNAALSAALAEKEAEHQAAAAALQESQEAAVTALEEQMMSELEITDYSALGTEYATDADGLICREDLLHGATYYVYETETLPGYNLDAAVYEFTVDDNGLIGGEDNYTIKIGNTPNSVEISKKGIIGEDELPGATLVVTDSSGEVMDEWVSTEEPHFIKALPAGVYTLTETAAPEGYAIADSVIFTVADSLEIQQVVMRDEIIYVSFIKKDADSGEPLAGATLTVTDAEGNVMDSWVTDGGAHVLNLAAGSYTLSESAAPDGYAKAEDVEFTVTSDQASWEVTMSDRLTQVSVSKLDVTDDSYLAGAKLIIKDSTGRAVKEWTSKAAGEWIEGLAAGDYALVEETAPEGYELADTVYFTVTDAMETQEIVMYDYPKDSTVDLTGKKESAASGTGTPGAGSSGGGSVIAAGAKTGDYFRYGAAAFFIMGGVILLICQEVRKRRKGK